KIAITKNADDNSAPERAITSSTSYLASSTYARSSRASASGVPATLSALAKSLRTRSGALSAPSAVDGEEYWSLVISHSCSIGRCGTVEHSHTRTTGCSVVQEPRVVERPGAATHPEVEPALERPVDPRADPLVRGAPVVDADPRGGQGRGQGAPGPVGVRGVHPDVRQPPRGAPPLVGLHQDVLGTAVRQVARRGQDRAPALLVHEFGLAHDHLDVRRGLLTTEDGELRHVGRHQID